MTYKFILSYNPKFKKLALDEIRVVDSKATLVQELNERTLLVSMHKNFNELSDFWKKNNPIFIQHIFQVHYELNLELDENDIKLITDAINNSLNIINPKKSFSVQTQLLGDFPFKPIQINSEIAKLVEKGTKAKLNIKNPYQVISILCHGVSKKCFVGISLAKQNLSKWSGGVTRYKIEKDQISRAELKLLEAVDTFDIDFSNKKRVLDLGASPGGWTRILLNKGLKVTAVDPADMDLRITANRNLTHFKMASQEYYTVNKQKFDVLANDMKKDPQDSARLVLKYSKFLNRGGIVIMTFKLPKDVKVVKRVINNTFDILKQKYFIKSAKNLFYNRNEITVYLGKKFI